MYKKLSFLIILILLSGGCAAKYNNLDAFRAGDIGTEMYYIKDSYQSVYRSIMSTGEKCVKEQWGKHADVRSNLYTDINKADVIFYVDDGIVTYAEVEQKENESILRVYYHMKGYIKPEIINKWAMGFLVCK